MHEDRQRPRKIIINAQVMRWLIYIKYTNWQNVSKRIEVCVVLIIGIIGLYSYL